MNEPIKDGYGRRRGERCVSLPVTGWTSWEKSFALVKKIARVLLDEDEWFALQMRGFWDFEGLMYAFTRL